MEAASLNLPITPAQASTFMTSMSDSKESILNSYTKNDASVETNTTALVKKEAQDESVSGIVPTLQYV